MAHGRDSSLNTLKTIAVGLSLSMASLLVLLLALEAYLRFTIDQSSELYADLTYNRALDAEYFRRSFLELYARDLDWRRGVYDPYLGWDQAYSPNASGARTVGLATYDLRLEDGVMRVVAIGDSFVFGSFVNSDETYPAYLESLLDDAEVLNMGVVGYGIDQAVLKYLAYGEQYDPDVVLLGTFPHDYVRTGLSFYGFAKPLFEFDEQTGVMELTNTDIPPPQEVYDALDSELDPPALYSFAFLKNRLTRVYWRLFGGGAEERYHREVDRIVEHVLLMLQESAQATGARLIIVQVPHGTGFRDEGAWLRAGEDATHSHLIALYEKLGIQYVDLLTEFRKHNSLERVYDDLYIRVSKNLTGHLTPEGNLEVARIVRERIDELGWTEWTREER